MYNTYQQTLNVPLIFSNPRLFPKPKSTEALAGLIDLMPTLASFAGVDPSQWTFQGKNLMPVITGKTDKVQDYLHFTYDDDYVATPTPWTMGASHIRCLIEQRKGKVWKYAVYFDPNYGQKMEYEMYELRSDPEEAKNLAHHKFSRGFEKERQRLHERLIEVMKDLGTMPDSVLWPKVSGGDDGKTIKRVKRAHGQRLKPKTGAPT
jgi:arylsulfatase A-like enzyme